MAKGTVVRGTPINTIRAGGQGISPNMPAEYTGTVNQQYQGDQATQPNPRSGTPYQSNAGNPGDASRTLHDHRYGVIPVNGGQDMNNPSSNGNGTLFDGMDRAKGFQPRGARTLDSPVSEDSPWFEGRTVAQENAAHLGANVSKDLLEDDLRAAPNGVMSK